VVNNFYEIKELLTEKLDYVLENKQLNEELILYIEDAYQIIQDIEETFFDYQQLYLI
jgi:hypothetical protein